MLQRRCRGATETLQRHYRDAAEALQRRCRESTEAQSVRQQSQHDASLRERVEPLVGYIARDREGAGPGGKRVPSQSPRRQSGQLLQLVRDDRLA
jgi:hypothetical protein